MTLSVRQGSSSHKELDQSRGRRGSGVSEVAGGAVANADAAPMKVADHSLIFPQFTL